MKGKLGSLTVVVAVFAAALAPTGAIAAENPPNEDAAIAVLNSAAGWQEKYVACTQLRQVGTAKSVPALAALLGDEKLSHMARYAMERMKYPEVDAALREALGTTAGMPRVGVIISIGARRDAKAVDALTPLLKDPDTHTARAAAGALGRIGTADAARALMKARASAPESLDVALGEGLLAACEHLVDEGDRRLATQVYQELQGSKWPKHIRMGAFAGLAVAQPRRTPERLITALAGDDDQFRNLAAQIIAESSGADTRRYAAVLPNLSASGQVALLRGLGDRGDSAAHAAVLAATTSRNKDVRLAALRALGQVGSEADVPALAALLVSDDPDVATVARQSLAGMKNDAVDAAVTAVASGAAPATRAKLIELLADRDARQAVPVALENLAAADPAVRLASLRVLGKLGGKDETPVVLAALKRAGDEAERGEAASALNAIASIQKDDVLPAVLEAMNGADTASRVLMLRALSQIGTLNALAPLVAATNDPDAQVGEEAVRVLANWRSADAAPHLLDLAKSDNASRRDQGLRGYIRLARETQDAAEKARMLDDAMKLTRVKEEKWLVLGAWGTLHTKQSLDTLLPYLDNADVQNEAAAAIVSVAAQLGKQNDEAKAQAVAALKTVLEKSKDEGIRERAQASLNGFGG